MIEVRLTEEFRSWLKALRDGQAKARILRRLDRLSDGNHGNVKFFDGIGELRVDYGPGYRVYVVQRGAMLVVMLCGGDKRTQDKDIARAKRMAKEI